MDFQKSQEETLREAACIGDFEAVQELLTKGVNPNSQNVMNGWTALHWSAKRGHRNIVQALLECGADTNVTNHKGETAASLATDLALAQLLGGVGVLDVSIPKKDDSFTPHYIAHPPLNQRVEKSTLKQPGVYLEQLNPASSINNKPNSCPNCCMHGEDSTRELVLKVRVANCQDSDFIEVEVPEASFSSLLRVCCDELGVAAQRVTRVRKLPNTVVRKDRDVQRLQYLQELELVVEGVGAGMVGAPFEVNGEVSATKSNSYQSISKYKNQTILY